MSNCLFCQIAAGEVKADIVYQDEQILAFRDIYPAVILLTVEQLGGITCHTGREHCFYKTLNTGKWVPVDPVLKDPGKIYDK